jgi:hypothetical protein
MRVPRDKSEWLQQVVKWYTGKERQKNKEMEAALLEAERERMQKGAKKQKENE